MPMVMSWDDGAPQDMRLAELLEQRGFGATFFIPRTNREGRETIPEHSVRELGTRFEIGAHTLDHAVLPVLTDDQAHYQIAGSKTWLEDILGHSIVGFCYTQGKYGNREMSMVGKAGFRYARTVVNGYACAAGHADVADLNEIPVTAQFYAHSAVTYTKNWLRHGAWLRRGAVLRSLAGAASFDAGLRRLMRRAAADGSIFHLWGHSWEVDETGTWDQLDELLRFAADLFPPEQRLELQATVAPRPAS
jgi:peptidoglycan-N-acetylglucosamine deacetylase